MLSFLSNTVKTVDAVGECTLPNVFVTKVTVFNDQDTFTESTIPWMMELFVYDDDS